MSRSKLAGALLAIALAGCTETTTKPPQGSQQGDAHVVVCAPGSFQSGNECIPVKPPECPTGTSMLDGQCVAPQELATELKTAAKTEADDREYENEIDPRIARRQPRSRQLLITELQGLESLFAAAPKQAPDRPKLIRRLAEGYVELAEAAVRDKKQAQTPEDSVKAEKIQQAAHAAAIKYYTLLHTEYPKFCTGSSVTTPATATGCDDETLYYLSLEYRARKDLDRMRKIMLELIQNWPQSKYVGNCYFLFGELFREEAAGDPSKWHLAEQSYAEAAKYPGPIQSPSYTRLADVYENLGDKAKAAAARAKAGATSRTSKMPTDP